MVEIRTIKGIDDATWADFKGLAAKNSQNVGSFFSKLLLFYKKESIVFWDDIFDGSGSLTTKEAVDLRKETVSLRKKRGFRDDLNF